MNIEDETDLKNAVDEAEYELYQLQEPYRAAEEKLAEARQRLADWSAMYG